MTIHLYYHDSYLREFTANVLDVRRTGGSYAVVLDRTAFYPASGGQPHDTGFLGSSRVHKVEVAGTGEIVHFAEAPVPPGPVAGRVDWERRFDHMQQHTGQHILSQAFLRVANAATLSFHLGQESSTIDLELASPSAAIVKQAEELASGTVFDNRPVETLNVDRGELQALGVRKESQRQGEIRVIDIDGFDRSACGGTHVRQTGEIGLVSVLGFEHYKGGTRVEFVCGGRALQALRTARGILAAAARPLSALPADVPRLVESLVRDRSALERELARAREELLEAEALELWRLTAAGGIPVLSKIFEDRDLETLKVLAQKTAARQCMAVLASRASGRVALARPEGFPVDCGACVRSATQMHGGKGGGRPEAAQAGGIAPENLELWIDAAVSFIGTILASSGQD